MGNIFILEDYVQDAWKTFTDAIKKKDSLESEIKFITDITPAPMNTMLTKQPRDEAIKKQQARKTRDPRIVQSFRKHVIEWSNIKF